MFEKESALYTTISGSSRATSCVSSLGKQESEPYIFCKYGPGLTWRPSTVKRTGFRSLVTISCDGAVPSRPSWTADGRNATFLTYFAEMKVVVGHLPVYTSHRWDPVGIWIKYRRPPVTSHRDYVVPLVHYLALLDIRRPAWLIRGS